MDTRHRWTWIAALAVTVALVVAAVAGELVARSRIESQVTVVSAGLPGVSAALSRAPVLMQLARGRVEVEVALSDATLSAYASCRTQQDLSVRAGDGRLVVTTQRTLRGRTVPVDVTLVPRRGDDDRDDDDRWSLVADSVSAAGVSLPADRALRLLSGQDGDGSELASRLLDGIPLPGDERRAVTAVSFRDGVALLTVCVAVDRPAAATGGRLAGLHSCLEDPEG